MGDENLGSNAVGGCQNQSQDATLWTKRQIAKRYNVCVRTIDTWTAMKILPHLKFGRRLVRYPVAECDRALAERFKISAR